MMSWNDNISLKKYNTFGINAIARHFAVFADSGQLAALLEQAPGPPIPAGGTPGLAHPAAPGPLILGGGSNILLTGDVDGLVLKNEITGIQLITEDEDHVY